MERKDVTIVRNLYDGGFYAIPSNEIVDGYLHDTYNDYGVVLDAYEAGDYTLGNPNFDAEMESHLRERFEELSEAVFYFGVDGIFDYDVELTKSQVHEINKEIKSYIEEHEMLIKAKYFNYWNGSNWQTVLIEAENTDTAYEIVEAELADEIYADFENAIEERDTNGVTYYEGKKYVHSTSRWQSNPFYFESEKK